MTSVSVLAPEAKVKTVAVLEPRRRPRLTARGDRTVDHVAAQIVARLDRTAPPGRGAR